MSRDELRVKLAEVLENDEPLNDDMGLDDLDNWDSVAMVTYIALIDENFHKQVSARQIRDCNTVGDLLSLATS
jgi:acyl carrier protein